MRLYNGCPDDELAAFWASRDKARADLKKADPTGTAWCTYFPVEEMYSCSRWDENGKFEELTPEFHPTVESACAAAIAYLKAKEKT